MTATSVNVAIAITTLALSGFIRFFMTCLIEGSRQDAILTWELKSPGHSMDG